MEKWLRTLAAALLLAGVAALSQAQNVFTSPTANGTAAVGQLPGTITNDSACATCVGVRLDASAAVQSVSLTTATAANITSLSLTAGDWELSAIGMFLPGATSTVSSLEIAISTVSATRGQVLGFFSGISLPGTILGQTTYTSFSIPPVRISLASPSTYFLVGYATFGVSTMTVGGELHAVRVR